MPRRGPACSSNISNARGSQRPTRLPGASDYVGRVLNGEQPEDLLVQQVNAARRARCPSWSLPVSLSRSAIFPLPFTRDRSHPKGSGALLFILASAQLHTCCPKTRAPKSFTKLEPPKENEEDGSHQPVWWAYRRSMVKNSPKESSFSWL